MMIEKIAHGITHRPKLVALIAVLLLIPSLLGTVATKVNYDILSYLPEETESARGEKLLEDPFKMAATSMLVVENMPAGYTNDLINAIKEVPGVSNALWLSNMVGIQIPTSMIPEEMRSVFFSGNATMMIIQYDNPGASEETMASIDQIRSICNEKCFLAGFSVVIRDTQALMSEQMPLFILVAVILALAAMSLAFSSWLLPVIFILNIGFAIMYNSGTNIFFGEISYVTQAISAVLQLGVTMDYGIFLYRRYEEEKQTRDKQDAMANAIVAAFTALSGSSLTTVAGFLALCSMQLTLGKDIGLVMAKGVVFGVITVVFILPALLLLFDRQIEAHTHRTLMPDLASANRFVIRHRKALVIMVLVLFIPSYYAQNHAPVYYKIDESLPDTMASIQANDKLKEGFDMASSHFIMVTDQLSSTEMNDMEARIKELDGVTGLVSYHAILGSGIPDFFVPDSVRNMLKQGGYQMLMVNTDLETATDAVSDQLKALRSIVKEYDPEAMVTGEAAMTDDLITTTATDFVTANYISIAAIFIIIAFVFRSVSVPVILVAIIEFAIFINQGIPYFTGTEVAFIAPTIISCVQLGATVDYAILMTTRFREEIQNGLSRKEAISIAANTSDASIITSAVVLFCSTLGVSLTTDIDLIGALCILLARGAIISAVICLFIMPAVLYVCEPLFARTSLNWRSPRQPKRKKTDRQNGDMVS